MPIKDWRKQLALFESIEGLLIKNNKTKQQQQKRTNKQKTKTKTKQTNKQTKNKNKQTKKNKQTNKHTYIQPHKQADTIFVSNYLHYIMCRYVVEMKWF